MQAVPQRHYAGGVAKRCVAPAVRGQAQGTAAMDRWAQLETATTKAGRRLAAMDGLIAATVLAHGLTLATWNQSDSEGRGVPLVDPWAGG